MNFTKTTTIETDIPANDYQRFWDSITVRVFLSDGSFQTTTLGLLTTNALTKKITLNNAPANPYATILQFQTTQATASFVKTKIGQYSLKVLDEIRDVILHAEGNQTLKLIEQNMKESAGGSDELGTFIKELKDSQSNKLGGMLLKTYDSDIFNNWIS